MYKLKINIIAGDKQSPEKKRSEVSMVLSIKTTSISDNDEVTEKDRSPSPFEHIETSDINKTETTENKRLQPEGAISIERVDESKRGHNEHVLQKNSKIESQILREDNQKPTVPVILNKSSWQENERETSDTQTVCAGQVPAVVDSESAVSSTAQENNSHKSLTAPQRVVTTLDVKPVPPVQKQVSVLFPCICKSNYSLLISSSTPKAE